MDRKSDPDKMVKRLMSRDQISQAEAERRIRSQMPQDDKVARAHRVIDNSGSRPKTKTQVLAALQAVRKALSLP